VADPLQQTLGGQPVEQAGHAGGVDPDLVEQLVGTGRAARRQDEQRGLLGGEAERAELRVDRGPQLPADLVQQGSTTEH